MATLSWKNDVDGLWSTASSWSGGAVPGSTDSVLLQTPSAHTVTYASGSASVNSIRSSTDLLVLSGGTLSASYAVLDGGLGVRGGTFALGHSGSAASLSMTSGGVVVASGITLAVQDAALSGGTLSGPGLLSNSGTVTIAAGGVTAAGGLIWSNSGTVASAGLLHVDNSGGARVNLYNKNVWQLTADGAGIGALVAQSAGSTFSNTGILIKTAGNGTASIDSKITSTGTIEVDKGTLALLGGGTVGGVLRGPGTLAIMSGSVDVSTVTDFGTVALLVGGGTVGLGTLGPVGGVVMSSGSLNLNGTRIGGPLTISGGTFVASGSITVNGAVNWSGGGATIRSGGRLLLNGAGQLGTIGITGPGTVDTAGTFTANGLATLTGALAWRNEGTLQISGDLAASSGTAIAFTNIAGARIELSGDGSSVMNVAGGAGSTLANAGLLIKTGSGVGTVDSAVNSTGMIDVVSGTLVLDGGGTLSGTLSGPGLLALTSGTFTGNSLTGDGTSSLLAAGANVTLNGGTLDAVAQNAGNLTLASAKAASLVISGGTAGISGTSSVSGQLGLSGGLLTITGATSVGGGINQTGGRLAIRSAVTVAGTSSLTGGNVITSGAALNLTGPATLSGSLDGPGVLSTSGAASIAAQTTFALGSALSWNNTGTLLVAGDLYAASGTAIALTNAAGGRVELSGDGSGITSATGSAGSTLANAGVLAKTGSGFGLVDSVVNSSGMIDVVSGTLALDSGGTLSGWLSGPGLLALTSGTFTGNSLSGDGTSSLLAAGANVTLNGGTLDAVAQNAGNLTLASAKAASLVISGGTAGISGTSSVSGQLGLSGGLLTITGATSVGGGINQTGGRLAIRSALTVAGTSSLTGGNVITSGATLNLTGPATLSGSLDGPGVLTTSGRTNVAAQATFALGSALSWNNTGTLLVAGDLYATSGTAIALTNAAGGRVELSGDGSGITSATGSAGSTLANAGVLAKTGSGFGLVDSVVNSTGMIDVVSGTLALDSGGTLSGWLSGPGLLALTSGTFTGNSLSGDGTSSLLAAGANVTLNGGTLDAVAQNAGNLTLASAKAASLVISGGTAGISGTSSVSGQLGLSGGLLTITGATSVGRGINQTGGRLAIRSALTVAGTSSLTGGNVITSGAALNLTGPATLSGSLDGPGVLTTSGATSIAAQTTFALGSALSWNNTGSLLVAGTITTGSGTQIPLVNATSGTVEFNGDGSGLLFSGGATPALVNAGALSKTLGGTSVVAGSLTNTGTVSVLAGVLELDGGGTLGGTLNGPGTLHLAAGNYSISAASDGVFTNIDAGVSVTSTATSYTGGMALSGRWGSTAASVTFGGPFWVTGGQTVSLAMGSTLTTLGSTILGGGIILGGTTGAVSWTNQGSAMIGGALGDGKASLAMVNAAGATLTLGDASSLSLASLTNSGTLSVAGSDTATVAAVFSNTGQLNLGTATLALTLGGTIGGSMIGNGTLALAGGAFTTTADFTNFSQNVDMQGGSLSTSASFSAGLEVDAGTLTITTPGVTINGGLLIDGGTLSLQQATTVQDPVTVTSGGVLLIAGGVSLSQANVSLADGATVAGAGTLATTGSTSVAADGFGVSIGNGLVWLNTGNVSVGGQIGVFGNAVSTIANAAGATFTLNADGAGIVTGDADSAFQNAGTLLSNGGFSEIDSTMTNNGMIEAANGTLLFTQTIGGTGTLQIDAGAALETSAIGSGQTLNFSGSGATLILDTAQSITTAIQGLGVGDSIDLANVDAGLATAQINQHTLTISAPGEGSFSFLSSSSLTGLTAGISDDGLGGVLVTLAASPLANVQAAAVAAAWVPTPSLAVQGYTPAFQVEDHTPILVHSQH